MKEIIIDNIRTSYYITEEGKCYNSKTNKYLKGQENYKNGYFSYILTMPDGSKKRCLAHRLVAIAFIPNNDSEKNQINHIDGNKLNNCVDNLEWVSQEENQQHAIQLGLRQFEHVFCFTKDKKLVAEYLSVADAAKAANLNRCLISQELNKDIKALTGGFYWSREKKLGATRDYKNTGKAKIVNQYDLNGKFIMQYPSTGIAAKAIGVKASSHIGECCRGKIKSYKGYVWRYAEDIVSPSSKSQRDVGETS